LSVAALLASLASAAPSTPDGFLAALAQWGATSPADLTERLRHLDAAAAATCLAAER
jgi:hypothetical protein